MGSKNVSEEVEWEARRVAAFGVEAFEISEADDVATFESHLGTTLIWCNIDMRTKSFSISRPVLGM